MFDKLIEESFSNASYMDVRELRSLYYGRVNMYVSFTDNSNYITEDKDRPDGIVCHQVDTVVGRKANTSMFYGRVFRIKKTGGNFIEDIKTHTNDSLAIDIDAIRTLSYLKPAHVEEVIAVVMSNVRLRRAFERLWEITKKLSKNNNKTWARILMDIGYIGFADQSGLGIITKKKAPVAILLDMSKKDDFDIVPLQKYRTDPRARIRDDVDKKVRLMATGRNRVAKKETGVTRSTPNKKGLVADLITAIGLI